MEQLRGALLSAADLEERVKWGHLVYLSNGPVLRQAAKSVKLGQVGVKLSFQVPDVDAFKAQAATAGLVFGATHQANGYAFANAKDPDKNPVSISSRAYRSIGHAP